MYLKLENKKAFISGSTQGIGYAIAQQLLAEGATVTINGRNLEKTERVRADLQEQFPNGKVLSITADFSNKKEVDRLLSEIEDFDILINNLGVFEVKDFLDITDDDWYNIFEINVMSSVKLCKKLLPNMLSNKWGRVIFISSESGVNIPSNMIHYGMTKAAMSSISNGLSKLTKGTEVTVNTILGGPTYSAGVASVVELIAQAQNLNVEDVKSGILQQTNPHILLQRFIKSEEIANLVTYIASPLSVATNGASLRVDSGVLKIT